MLAFANPAQAGVQEVRVVAAGVDNLSTRAEEKAMDYARIRAVFLTARKMGVADAEAKIAKFNPEIMSQIIRGYTVNQIKREGEVTYADVTVTIVDEALRRALKLPITLENVAAPQTVRTRGILLLPVMVTPNRTYLWEKENTLRPLLTDILRRESLAGVMLSGGDFDDLRLVDYENAAKVTGAELAPMFDRYGAHEVVFAVVTLGEAATSEPTKILLRRLTPTQVRHELMQVAPETPEEIPASRLNHAARAIAHAAAEIAASTSEEDRARLEKANKIPVQLHYTTPRDYAAMQTIIQNAPHVLLLELPSIALNEVQGMIYVEGDPLELRQALGKAGVIITEQDKGWRASMR